MLTRPRPRSVERTPHLMPRVLAIALLILCALAPRDASAADPTMRVHCIDVGQGASALIEFPCGVVLVDAGADTEHRGKVSEYLETFFARRPDLNRTIDLILITHSHLDHTSELRAVVETFTVKRVIDNGTRAGSGRHTLLWLQNEGAAAHNVDFEAVTHEQITSDAGLTSTDIDPIHCADCDPEIHILAASREENPGWADGEFENDNNHSLVIRIDFGESSFLFTGDLEEVAIETLLTEYADTGRLDVDVYHVGHHGSHNATTDEFLHEMSPHIAVISMGNWTFGKDSGGRARPFTTFAYGHPRTMTLDRLQEGIPGYRSRPVTIMSAERAREYREYVVRKRVYATGWEGTVQINATTDRRYRTTSQGVGR